MVPNAQQQLQDCSPLSVQEDSQIFYPSDWSLALRPLGLSYLYCYSRYTYMVGLLAGTTYQAVLNPAGAMMNHAALLIAFLFTGTTSMMVASAQEMDHTLRLYKPPLDAK
jgi:hypothetical protein